MSFRHHLIFLFFAFFFLFFSLTGLPALWRGEFPGCVFAFWIFVTAPEFAAAFAGAFFDEVAFAAFGAHHARLFLNLFNMFAFRIFITADEEPEPAFFYDQLAVLARGTHFADLRVFFFDFLFRGLFFWQL